MHLKRIHLDQVDSTNAYISRLIKDRNANEEMLVTTDYQDNGKGQGGHVWNSNPGKNVLMSLFLKPAFLSASDQFHLSRVASLAICDILKVLGIAPHIKWPNDVLVEGKKIAGILIENGIIGKNISHTIIGIGLNLNQEAFPGFPLEATSILLEGEQGIEPSEAVDRLTLAVIARFSQLSDGMEAKLEREYLEQMFLLNVPAEFIADEEKFTGTIRGVNEHGELMVESNGTTRNYAFQQIKMR